jgi:murein DD-endopeptidase MepM/ murein hydrolase activator NlpD
MNKVRYSLLSILSLLTLSACQTLWKAQTAAVSESEPASVISLPTTDIALPTTDFSFIFPSSPELHTADSPRKDITENFSETDKKEISVADPKLMGDSNSLIVDLGLIQKGDYAFPLPGAKVISPYGGRRKHHSGVDIKTCANDTIVSAFDGIVRMAKPYFAYGNIVVVRHYNGLETLYSHNSKNFVKPGDKVKAGQPIALTGRTGRATTEHLHFEVRVNGQTFNPNIIFDLNERKLNDQCLVFTQNGNKVAVSELKALPHQMEGHYTYSSVPPKKQTEVEAKKEAL